MRGKRLVRGTILTVLCMVGMLYLNSSVSKAYWVVVKSDNTRVRNAAGTDSEVMTAVNAGDKLDVYSEEQGSDGQTWYKVSINNVSGYVRADTVEKAAEGDAALTASTTTVQTEPVETAASSTVESMPSQVATVKQDDVNVRSEASTSAGVVAKLKSGAAVTLTGTSSDSEGKKWYQVNFINNGSNVTGFIREDFVEPGEVVDPAPAEETPEGEGGEDELAEMYGDMPTEGETAANNDYELFFEPDQDGVDCWYVHDNIAQKRYKLEQLLQADEMNTHNVEIKDQEIRKMRIAVIILAALFVIALVALGIFGFKYHDLKEDDDEDEDDDDEDDDFREAPPVRRRAEAEARTRNRESARGEVRSTRGTARRPEAGGARRPAETEGRTVQRRPQPRREEEEIPRKPAAGAARTRSAQPAAPVRRTPAHQESAPVRRTARPDVEWKSKNFLKEDDDDFSFINMDDDE